MNESALCSLKANVKEAAIEIPHHLHNSIIGAKGRLIRAIMEECGGVIIRFPPEGNNSDKVTIRGPKDDVESAKKQLLELVNEKVWVCRKLPLKKTVKGCFGLGS